MIPLGREFYKMTGSGNDFVFVNAMAEPPGPLVSPEVVSAICSRGNGIGADGICFITASDRADVGLIYLNADASRADLCGNATLCTARLARELGIVQSREFRVATDSGVLAGRFVGHDPEIDMPLIADLRPDAGISLDPGEQQIGFAMAGVPHVVVLTDALDAVDVVSRGRPLRHHSTLRGGANVNFVQPMADGSFRYRTYERGVEAETLACGTGAVAVAALLTAWRLASGAVRLKTRSGRELRVRFSESAAGQIPSLAGEARLVFRGNFGELAPRAE